MKHLKQLWNEWRCRKCGAKAARNIDCFRWRHGRLFVRRITGCADLTVNHYGLEGCRYGVSITPPKDDAEAAVYFRWQPGFYCRKCGFLLARTVPELFQVFAGLLTREEALNLYDKK